MPAFFDSVWFAGDDDQGRRQQAWFAHVGGGLNLRTAAGLPLVLTKRMAHNVPLAPADSTITEALRFGQVIGTGGSPLFLSMKSRSLPKLLRQVERWRRAWSIEVEEPPDSQGQGNRRLTYLYLETEDERTGELLVWTIQELRSARSLANEGHAMGHCLSSKAVKLATTSIWSVQVRDGERSRRVMTVGMVAPASRGDSARGKPSCWLRPIPFCASGSTARRSPTASWSCNPPGIRLALIRGPDQLRRMTASSTAGAAGAKI